MSEVIASAGVIGDIPDCERFEEVSTGDRVRATLGAPSLYAAALRGDPLRA
ncbi:MAG: hypothetical protein FJ090_04845 [Deltaproteobacteria bacterium]|nr:hypothetical protein [Deltaproteobacteria bacterium]